MRYENLHNHTTFSDGAFTPEELITEAINIDLDGIGISDHYATNKVKSVINIDEYFYKLSELKKKYKTEISIYSGLEIDFSPRTDIKYLLELKPILEQKCDYLLFEYVENGMWNGYSLKDFLIVRNMLKQIPIGLAHTFIKTNILGKHEDFENTLSKNNVFIELCSGSRNLIDGKPNYIESKDFIIKNKALLKFSTASDTHKNIQELSDVKAAFNFAKQHELNLISLISKK